MPYSLAQAAKAVGCDRSMLLRMIKLGRLSAERDPASGAWAIQPAELHRLYPPVHPHVETHPNAQSSTGDAAAQVAALQAQLDAAAAAIRIRDEVIADLRQDRDRAHEERRAVQARLDAVLTDQRSKPPPAPEPPSPSRRRWWKWRG
jgi:hypothetical protein